MAVADNYAKKRIRTILKSLIKETPKNTRGVRHIVMYKDLKHIDYGSKNVRSIDYIIHLAFNKASHFETSHLRRVKKLQEILLKKFKETIISSAT